MPSKRLPDVLVLGAGPAGMAIASALGKEKLEVEVLSLMVLTSLGQILMGFGERK